MDRYQRVEKPKPESPIQENEIRITTQGFVRNYVSYGISLLQDKHANEITLKAMGQAINKAVAVVEFLKKQFPKLHQDTTVSSLSLTDVWEPIEEGLLPVETTRQVSMISITLSTTALNKSSPGYQAPVHAEESKSKHQQRQPSKFRDSYDSGYGDYGRGRGRGRGRGWGRGYGNYYQGDNYNQISYDQGYDQGHGGGYERGRGGGYERGSRGGGFERGRIGGYERGRGGGYARGQGVGYDRGHGGAYDRGYDRRQLGGYESGRGSYARGRGGDYEQAQFGSFEGGHSGGYRGRRGGHARGGGYEQGHDSSYEEGHGRGGLYGSSSSRGGYSRGRGGGYEGHADEYDVGRGSYNRGRGRSGGRSMGGAY